MPAKAREPAGLNDLEGVAIVNDNDSRLRLHLQRLQGQLTQQQLYQDATHVMVQRAAQLEIDLDDTAAMLCDETTQGAVKNDAILKLQELCALEQKHCEMAMAAMSGLNLQLCTRDQELRHCNEQLIELRKSNEQLLAALAKLKADETFLAEHNWSPPSSSASLHPAAAMGDMPMMPIPATPSVLASPHVTSRCSAAQPRSQHACQLLRQRSNPCW